MSEPRPVMRITGVIASWIIGSSEFETTDMPPLRPKTSPLAIPRV
jgi:hypothetical protein